MSRQIYSDYVNYFPEKEQIRRGHGITSKE